VSPRYLRLFVSAAVLATVVSLGHAADAEGMKNACRVHAAGELGVSEGGVEVKYEGQRTDGTHAVNGSANVRGRGKTFQCSFGADGRKITRFVVNEDGGDSEAVDAKGMKNACRIHAAGELGVSEGAVEVKYEGQRTDGTHAVNGAANVRGREETFQCSFASNGRKITRFVVNKPEGETAHISQGGVRHDHDAIKRASRGEFDATGRIPCARHKGQPAGECDFGVARAGNGTAAVAVKLPGGGKRMIFFKDGKAVGSDHSEADRKGEFRATKESDLFIIRIGDERFEIPEAVVFGG
jgi:hypothetical protein